MTSDGRSFDGKTLVGSASFTHDVPAPPQITAPELADDPAQPGDPVARDGLVVDWDPVTETVDGAPVTTTGYEVIVTKEDHDDPHGFSRPVYDVHVPAALDALSVPAEFLEPDTVYGARGARAGRERQPDHHRRLLRDRLSRPGLPSGHRCR